MGRKNLWLSEVGRGSKKVEKHWPRQMVSNYKPRVIFFKSVANLSVTAAIPVMRFGGKVLVHSANSIAVPKGILDDGINFNSYAKKYDRLCWNGVDTATGFLE